MSWIGLNDFLSAAFSPGGLDCAGHPRMIGPAVVDEALERGTLLFELPCPDARVTALHYRSSGPVALALRVTLDRLGIAQLEYEHGPAHFVLAVRAGRLPQDAPLRLAFSWDARSGLGQLAVTAAGQPETCRTAEYEGIAAVPVGALRAMVLDRPAAEWDPSVLYVAVADHLDPQGLPAGLTAGTFVDTPAGPTPVERLKPPALVTTAANGARPVRWTGQRVVPARGSFTPVALRAPYFGLTADVMVAGTQRILLSGDPVDYLFGRPEILAEARHLVDGRMARFVTRAAFVRLVIPVFDGEEILQMAGCRVEGPGMSGRAPPTDRALLDPAWAGHLRSALRG